MLEVGVVTRPHGIAGEVKVQLLPEYLEALEGARFVYLDDSSQPRRIQAYRVHQGAALLRLERVDTRNDAEELRGARVSIRLRELPKLPEGEFYSHDLLGMNVYAESGEPIGQLTEVLGTGSNDVYVIKRADGTELLLPAIESVVKEIDVEKRVMKVVVPEGL
jgi:16S rRNA processing protein RimM